MKGAKELIQNIVLKAANPACERNQNYPFPPSESLRAKAYFSEVYLMQNKSNNKLVCFAFANIKTYCFCLELTKL